MSFVCSSFVHSSFVIRSFVVRSSLVACSSLIVHRLLLVVRRSFIRLIVMYHLIYICSIVHLSFFFSADCYVHRSSFIVHRSLFNVSWLLYLICCGSFAHRGIVVTIRPPDGFRPNQAHRTSPMVCKRRPCTRQGHSPATDRAIQPQPLTVWLLYLIYCVLE